MINRIELWNIGCFPQSDKWFKGDMTALENLVTVLFPATIPKSLPIERSSTAKEEIEKFIYDRITDLGSLQDKPVIMLAFHGHGTNDDSDWMFWVNTKNGVDEYLSGCEILQSLKTILNDYTTFVFINSCSGLQIKILTEIGNLPQPTPEQVLKAQKVSTAGIIQFENVLFTTAGRTAIQKIKQNDNSVIEINNDPVIIDNALFQSQQNIKFFCIVSASSVDVYDAGEGLGYVGQLFILLIEFKAALTFANLFEMASKYLMYSHAKVYPQMSIVTNNTDKAISNYFKYKLSLGTQLKMGKSTSAITYATIQVPSTTILL